MLTVFRKTVGGRTNDRYFSDWDNAKKEMDADVEHFVSLGLSITRKIDRFNLEKGYYEYEVYAELNEEPVVWFLFYAYFED